MNFKNLLSGKGFGIYVVLASIVLSVVTAIVYGICLGQVGFMSWEAVVSLIVGAVIAAGLFLLGEGKFVRFAPAVLFATVLFAFIMAINSVYDFIISGAFWDGFTVPVQIILGAVFLVLSIVASIVAVFAPIEKENA